MPIKLCEYRPGRDMWCDQRAGVVNTKVREMVVYKDLAINGHPVCQGHYDKIMSGGPRQWNTGIRPEFMQKRKRV